MSIMIQEKRIFVASRKGYCSLDAKAWASWHRLVTGKHYLSEPGPSQFGHLGTWCSEWLLFPLRTKCRLVGGNQRGESLLSSLLLFSPLAPRPTARLLEFKFGHVLAITLPQWPCWAQHFESHKNIIVQLLGSFVYYHKDLEKTKLLTPQGFAEAHFSDSDSSLPLKSSTLLRLHWHTSQRCPTGTSSSNLVNGAAWSICCSSNFHFVFWTLLHKSSFLPSCILLFCSQMFLFAIHPCTRKSQSLMAIQSLNMFIYICPAQVPAEWMGKVVPAY